MNKMLAPESQTTWTDFHKYIFIVFADTLIFVLLQAKGEKLFLFLTHALNFIGSRYWQAGTFWTWVSQMNVFSMEWM